MIIFKLREVMEKKNITENDLKKYMNRNTVKNLLGGIQKRIDYTVLDKLCYILDCQPGELLEYKSDENNKD